MLYEYAVLISQLICTLVHVVWHAYDTSESVQAIDAEFVSRHLCGRLERHDATASVDMKMRRRCSDRVKIDGRRDSDWVDVV